MNTLAFYLRVSKEDSNLRESATIQNQRDLLHHYVQNQPEFVDCDVLEFIDDGWSGTTFDRPGMKKLLKMAGKEVSCIIVKDFSRFGRNLIEVGDFLDQIFPFLGVRFIAVNENYDSKNNIGRTIGLDVSLRAMIYELYSRDLSKKISSVKEGKMRKGQYTGSFSFFGYQRTDTTTSGLIADPEASAIVKRIFSLAVSGLKTKQIAIALNKDGVSPPLLYHKRKYPGDGYQCPTATKQNVWTQARVAAILKDERYIGVLVSKKRKRVDISSEKIRSVEKENWIRVENAMEPIITKEEYEQAQKIFLNRSTGHPTSKSTELFRGLQRCAYCGKALDKVPNKMPYFRCGTGIFHPELSCADVNVDKLLLETTILTSLQSEFERENDKQSCNETVQPKSKLEKQLSEVSEDIKKCMAEKIILFEKYGAGQIDKAHFLAERQEIIKQIDELYEKQETLKKEYQTRENMSVLKMDVPNKRAALQSLSREMLIALVKEIHVWQDNRIEIVWGFCDMN